MTQEANTMNIVRLTGNRARARRYRAVHRRLDYVPSARTCFRSLSII